MIKKKLVDLLPFVLSFFYAALLYVPYSDRMLGWGDDPAFNLWTLEEVWRNLNRYGIFKIFSDRFWTVSIFHPQSLCLALSENQIYLGILSWPLRLVTGNGVLTLGWMALFMSFVAFIFAALWLRSLGFGKIALWGALIFQVNGWLESQYAHYQHICIFLFPMALWLWQRFKVKPTYGRLAACALAFGWFAGWNVYFQIFANLIFLGMMIPLGFNRKKSSIPWKKLVLLTVAVALVQLPVVWKYWQFESYIGAIHAEMREYRDYSAQPLSFLSHAQFVPWITRLFSFYPLQRLNIEASGFLGFSWLALMLVGLRNRKWRIWGIVALLCYWVAMGPAYLAFYPAMLLPGIKGVRSIGRLCLLVWVFSVPMVLAEIQRHRKWVQVALVFCILFELTPGRGLARTPIPAGLYDGLTPFQEALKKQGEAFPLWVAPGYSTQFQATMTALLTPLYGGYSSRALANWELLTKMMDQSALYTPQQFDDLIRFSQASRVATLTPDITERFRRSHLAHEVGCFEHFDLRPCLFIIDPQKKNPPAPSILHLSDPSDFKWISVADEFFRTRLVALREGTIDYGSMGSCWIEGLLQFHHLPTIHTRQMLGGWSFNGFMFKKGDTVAERFSKGDYFAWPEPWRATMQYVTHCKD